MFITKLLSKLSEKTIQASTTTFQRLAKGAYQSVETLATMTLLLLYTRRLKFMFAKDNFDILPEYRYWDHIIKLLPGSEPKSTKVYLLFLVEQKELNTFLEKNLYTRQICLFKLSIVILVFFIKKKNSFLWLIQNYQVFNSMIVKNKYSLPLISKLVFQLYKTKYFTKLDIQ